MSFVGEHLKYWGQEGVKAEIYEVEGYRTMAVEREDCDAKIERQVNAPKDIMALYVNNKTDLEMKTLIRTSKRPIHIPMYKKYVVKGKFVNAELEKMYKHALKIVDRLTIGSACKLEVTSEYVKLVFTKEEKEIEVTLFPKRTGDKVLVRANLKMASKEEINKSLKYIIGYLSDEGVSQGSMSKE